MDLVLRPPVDGDTRAVAALAAQCQADPEFHIPYVGLTPESIEADIGELGDWTECSIVAEQAGEVVGALIAELDEEMGRLWWWGPFVSEDATTGWSAIADRLYDETRAVVPAAIAEEEACADDRSKSVRNWCDRHGLVPETASVLLRRQPEVPPSPSIDSRVRPMVESDHEAVTALHESAFPGTHATPEALVRSSEPRLVIETDATPGDGAPGDGRTAVGGYIAYELHADGSGYIDFLAVDPELRNAGLGAALVDTACALMFDGGVGHVHLTVREDNAAARALYAGLGFVEDRLARPFRRGFHLD
jgi:ribosomal protein S18 acetylase RimI-like enzyme